MDFLFRTISSRLAVMSNRVGELYNIIIENVIKETKNEFEESGDDPAVLEMLKKTWRNRLLNMNVTKKPLWFDAMPPPNPQTLNGKMPQSAPGTVPGSLGTGTNVRPPDNLSISGDSLGLYGMPPSVKIEPSSSTNGLGNDNLDTQVSSERQGVSQHPLFVKDNSYDVLPNQSSQQNQLNSGRSNGSTPQPGNAPFNPLDSSKASYSTESPQPGQMQLSAELQNQIQNAMNNNSSVAGNRDNSSSDINNNSGSANPRVPQSDGPQDEELNSDLDDSEDELNSNDEDEDTEQTQIMLCLYEKVHKVKTRWKYTLKDGVANINGLDYVFTRATGESEW